MMRRRKRNCSPDKLEALAVEEQLVYETLGGVPCEQGTPSDAPAKAAATKAPANRSIAENWSSDNTTWCWKPMKHSR